MVVVVVRRGDGVRTRRHAVRLEVGRVRLCDDVNGARRVLVFVPRGRGRRLADDDCTGGGFGGGGLLEGGVGGVEGAAERLREGAAVFGGCCGCCAECGHGGVLSSGGTRRGKRWWGGLYVNWRGTLNLWGWGIVSDWLRHRLFGWGGARGLLLEWINAALIRGSWSVDHSAGSPHMTLGHK